jgi:D-arginine dehydrogenase
MLSFRMMGENAEIVVIGAGFAGAATAWHLTRRGVTDVVVLEAEDGPGLHASGRNASLVFHLLKDPDEARLVREGARFYSDPPRSFCDRPLFRRSGSLLVASDDGAADLGEAARDAERLGLSGVKLVRPVDAIARVPLLRGAPIAVALENPHDGVVDIHNLLVSYLGGARFAGARIHYGTRVRGIGVEDGHVVSVVTDRGRIDTRSVVNAAGAWAGAIGVVAGVGPRTIRPLRRHIYRTRRDPRIDPEWPFVWHDDIDVYFRPEEGGLLVSPCDADPHPAEAPVPVAEGERSLREKLGRAFPALGAVELAMSRACLRTFVADDRFLIGRDPELEGFFWVAALGGHGMSTSHAVGRLAAAAVLGDETPELRAFAPSRLARHG